MRIGAVIQARMTSKRFPGKVLAKICGKPMLQYLLENLAHCTVFDQLVVATSVEPSDNPIAEFCRAYDVPCCRGPLQDVARRFIEVINVFGFECIIRINGDSPLMDYRIIERAVSIFKSKHYNMVTNVLKRTFPKGQSVEVIDSEIFKLTYPMMKKEDEREHVTKYFYLNHERFSIYNLQSDTDYGTVQLSVDTPEDMCNVEAIISSMNDSHWEYAYEELVSFIA